MPGYEQTPIETQWARRFGPDGEGNHENEMHRPSMSTTGRVARLNLGTERS